MLIMVWYGAWLTPYISLHNVLGTTMSVLPPLRNSEPCYFSGPVLDGGLNRAETTSRSSPTPEANIIHSFNTSFSLFPPIPFSMGSLAFARAAHIDLALVPFIGTSIDLEISLSTAYKSGAPHLRKQPRFWAEARNQGKKKHTKEVRTLSSKRPCWLRPVLADWLEHQVIRAGSRDIVQDATKATKISKVWGKYI